MNFDYFKAQNAKVKNIIKECKEISEIKDQMVEELVNCVTTAVYYISHPKIEMKNVSWIAEVLDPFFLDKDRYQVNMYGRKKV